MHPEPAVVKLTLLTTSLLATCVLFYPRTAGAQGEPGPPLRITFFFTPGCRMCKPTKAAVRKAEAAFGDQVGVEWVNLADPESGTASASRLFRMLDEYGEKSTPPLVLFAGGTCLAGGETIIARVDETISRELAGGARPRARASAVDRMGFWTVSAAALADGVNPCAFATVVLLVSMMASARKTRRQTLVIGVTFTTAVYATYFLIGLAFFGVLSRLQAFLIVSDLVFCAAFGACVVFGLLSLYDATLAWREKEPGRMLLKVPEFLRDRMAKHMRAGIRSRHLVLGAILAGVVVSLLESACTGQVYFPVIAGLIRDDGTRSRGLTLLAWYNLLFVFPLVVVFALAFIGVTSERLAGFGRKHWGVTKLLLGLVFIAMACWMVPGLVWPPGAR